MLGSLPEVMATKKEMVKPRVAQITKKYLLSGLVSSMSVQSNQYASREVSFWERAQVGNQQQSLTSRRGISPLAMSREAF